MDAGPRAVVPVAGAHVYQAGPNTAQVGPSRGFLPSIKIFCASKHSFKYAPEIGADCPAKAAEIQMTNELAQGTKELTEAEMSEFMEGFEWLKEKPKKDSLKHRLFWVFLGAIISCTGIFFGLQTHDSWVVGAAVVGFLNVVISEC